MKFSEMLSVIRRMSCLPFYQRWLYKLSLLQDDDPTSYLLLVDYLEEKNFKDAIDLIICLETDPNLV